MKNLRIGAILGALLMVAAACSSTPAGKTGGTLIVALPGDIVRTDTALTDDSNSSYVIQQVVEGLVGLEPGSTSKVVPVLAESYEMSADGLTYTFKLRSGIKFHDGTDFNADAVVFNYNRFINIPTELQDYTYYIGAVFGGYGETSNLESATAVDDSTVALKLKKPSSNFILTQTLPVFGIQSPTALALGKGDNTESDVTKITGAQGGAGAMVGTGPFKFVKWTVGDSVEIEKNADYWDKEKVAYVDAIVFKAVAEEAQRLNGLAAGEIDLAQTIAPVDAATIAANEKLQLIDRGSSFNTFQISMNHNYAPVSNAKIREAIAYAIDYEYLIETFYAGAAVKATNWMPAGVLYAKDLALPSYDVEKAKQLIAESGETDLTIDFWYPNDVTRPYMPDPKGLFEAITANLEAVGFTINPNNAPWRGGYLDDEYAGKYEMWLLGWTGDWAGPDNFLKTAFFGYVDGAPSTEFAYKNDALEAAMNAALAAGTEAEAKTQWELAQDLIRADMPTVPIANSKPQAAASIDLKGFIGSAGLNEPLNLVWLDRP
ncbi:MAG: ABC transporter substrate-binding protein [Candidatus Limnocylindrus sp.]